MCLLKFISIESVMLYNHLILCHPLLFPSIFPSIRVFSNESVLCIRWPKYWRFSFSISPSNQYSGLISLSQGSCLPLPSITVPGVQSPPPPASLSWGSWSAPDHPPPPPASLLGGLSPQGCRVGVCAVVSGRVFFPRAVESQGLAGRQEASSGSHGAHCLLRVRSLGLESTFRREHSESQFH